MNPETQEITATDLAEQTAVLLERRDEIVAVLERAKQMKAEVDAELTKRCLETTSKALTLVPDGRIVKIITIRDFKEVPLEFADKYEATQLVVNTKVLKALADTGTFIPNVIETERLYVK